MKARICIIGNGAFANRVHYPTLCSMESVEVVGICAYNENKLRQTALRFGIPENALYMAKTREDYQQMLQELRPDGVYVIGRPGCMFDCWVWCLQHRFNLFVEKPLGITSHQARTLAYLAKTNACVTQVSFQRRSSPLLNKVHRACLERGAINHATVEFHKCDPIPMFCDRDRMLDDYVHAVDTARWVCGGEVVKITSHCRRLQVPDINLINAMLYFDNGSTCYVASNWTSGRRIFRVTLHAFGICADIEVEKEAFLYENGNYDGIRYDAKEISGSEDELIYCGFRRKSEEFIHSVISGKDVTSSPFSDALKTMEVCETILAQAQLAGI